ncbi:hypothetical protein D3C87_1759730 [compost metagenome]
MPDTDVPCHSAVFFQSDGKLAPGLALPTVPCTVPMERLYVEFLGILGIVHEPLAATGTLAITNPVLRSKRVTYNC